MYPLTEFSESKLRLMAELIQSRLTHEESVLRINDELPVHDVFDVHSHDRLSRMYSATITDLKEMNVWVLTSLQMVKSESTIQQS